MSEVIGRCLRVPNGVFGSLLVSECAYWHLRVTTGAYWCLRVPNGNLKVSTGF